MQCPKDHTELVAEIYEASIEIDKCPVCGGIWLDAGELEQIQETIENDYSDKLDLPDNTLQNSYEVTEQLREEQLTCPKCGDAMIKKEYAFTSQVVIDICISCRGIWLDAGELQRLEIFYEKQLKKDKNASRISLLWDGIKNFFNK